MIGVIILRLSFPSLVCKFVSTLMLEMIEQITVKLNKPHSRAILTAFKSCMRSGSQVKKSTKKERAAVGAFFLA